jgi:hypothetical protein
MNCPLCADLALLEQTYRSVNYGEAGWGKALFFRVVCQNPACLNATPWLSTGRQARDRWHKMGLQGCSTISREDLAPGSAALHQIKRYEKAYPYGLDDPNPQPGELG